MAFSFTGFLKGLLLQNEVDRSKQLIIQASPSATTGTATTVTNSAQTANQTIIFPNITGTDTLTANAAIQTLTNKSIDGGSNTFTNLPIASLSALTANQVLATNGSGVLTTSTVTPTTLAFLDATSSVQTQLNSKLNLSGGTMTGALDMGTHQIHNVTDPTAAQDAATKNYVDMIASALNPATAVYAATAGSNIPGTYFNGAAGIGATFTTTSTAIFTLDGTTPPVGSRILIKDQSTGFQNGIYTLTAAAVPGISGTVFTRALDYDTPADINSAGLIPVINGTLNALTSWQQVATITIIGTDALVFTEFTANPSLYLLKANNLSDVASKTISFNNISPMTTGGDIIYGGTSGAGTRLANGSSGQVLTSGGGTAAPTWTSALINPMTTGGDIIYGGSSGTPTRLANGTAGQILQSSGTTVAPVWVSLPGASYVSLFYPSSASNYWINTSSSTGDFSFSGTIPTPSTIVNNMAGVAVATGSLPGFSISSMPRTGVVKVTCTASITGGLNSAATTWSLNLLETTTSATIALMGGSITANNTSLLHLPVTMIGYFSATSGLPINIKLKGAISSGTLYIGGALFPGATTAHLFFTAEYIT